MLQIMRTASRVPQYRQSTRSIKYRQSNIKFWPASEKPNQRYIPRTYMPQRVQPFRELPVGLHDYGVSPQKYVESRISMPLTSNHVRSLYEGIPTVLHVSHEERWALGKVQRYMPRPYAIPHKGYPRACISVTMDDTATFSALNDAQYLCHPFTDREMLTQPKAYIDGLIGLRQDPFCFRPAEHSHNFRLDHFSPSFPRLNTT
jgi:hypothetical protein